MGDRNAAMLQALQQLTRQRQPQQQSNGRPSLNSIIEMMNGTASGMEFASSTGSGGTWQRDNSNGNSYNTNGISNGMNGGYSMMSNSNNMQSAVTFKCSECAISKYNCEDLEIHIKTEHLNWLPFRCQFCSAQRASDAQMREHVYSSHKRDDNKYLYFDNPHAKRKLTQMLDKALILATVALAAKKQGHSMTSNGTNHSMAKRPRLENHMMDTSEMDVQPRASATVTVLPRSNTSDILAHLNASRNDNEEVPGQIDDSTFNVTESAQDDQTEVDDLTTNQLSQLFGNNGINMTNDFEEEYNNDSSYLATDNEKSLIENIQSLFSGATNTPTDSFAVKQKPKMTRAPRNMNCVSKKRVLGECSRCQKPVTAGARQMHMFYHLAKDQNTYRFKCKFADCDVQHYRKDQMENHQSKMHGKIDPEMMEDRSSQLHEVVQVLSMELLGTAGNQPGPTAERAQAIYNDMQRDAAEANKKRRRSGFVRSEQGVDNPLSPSTSASFLDGLPTMVKPEPRLEEQIECSLCKKFIVARTRGFHILWHLNNDLNIVRYHCKHCDFKHDRSQSISNHGMREHNDEKCVIDTISKYDEEIRSMSKACFGIEQPFTKESSRTKRIRREEAESGKPKIEDILFPDQGYDVDMDVTTELDENDQLSDQHSETSDEQKPAVPTLKIIKSEAQQPQTTGTQPVSAVAWTARKSKHNRRFGTRKPKSKKQKQEMAKQRELSMVLGGAQYFKRKPNEAAYCNKCDKPILSRLSQHAYSHIDQPLFECPECHLGNCVRENVSKHMKDLHGSNKNPIDNRLKYAIEIKESIKECYPEFFIDAPIPTQATIEKLKQTLGIEDDMLGGLEQDDDEANGTVDTINESENTIIEEEEEGEIENENETENVVEESSNGIEIEAES